MNTDATLPRYARQRGESRQGFAAFVAYRDLGPSRSLAKVGRALGKSVALLERWSARWAWVARAAAYDDHLDQQRRAAWVKAVEDMAQRHATIACMMQEKVVQRLN